MLRQYIGGRIETLPSCVCVAVGPKETLCSLLLFDELTYVRDNNIKSAYLLTFHLRDLWRGNSGM